MIYIRENVEREATGTEAERLVRLGYKPAGGDFMNAPVEEPEPVADLESMTAGELKKLAKSKGLAGASGLTKKELIEVLKG